MGAPRVVVGVGALTVEEGALVEVVEDVIGAVVVVGEDAGPTARFTNASVVVLVGMVGLGVATGAPGAVVPPGVVMMADAVVGATTVMAASPRAPKVRRRRGEGKASR